MTDLEQRAVRALRGVRVKHTAWNNRCVAALNNFLTVGPEARLGITQEADLWFLVWRYRRQIADHKVVAHADELMNGARSLSF